LVDHVIKLTCNLGGALFRPPFYFFVDVLRENKRCQKIQGIKVRL